MTFAPELLQSLKTAPLQLESFFAMIPAAQQRWKPDSWEGTPGEMFSAAEHLSHVRDIEIDGYQVRIRRLLQEENPELISLDSYQLAREKNYAADDPASALKQFRDARRETLELLEAVTPEQLDRRGHFEGYGDVTLKGIVHFLSSHDQQHLACLQWLMGKMSA